MRNPTSPALYLTFLLVVTEAEFKAKVKHALQESDDKIIYKTPEKETKLIERYLEMSEGTFGESFVKIYKGAEKCKRCHRHYSFLDITTAGIKVHGKEIIKNIFCGKYGHIWNKTPLNTITCFGCEEPGDIGAVWYVGVIYGCA